MLRNSFQKGSVKISTFAGMAIIAAVVVVVSTIAVIKYREVASTTVPVAVITSKLTPAVTPTPVVDETADWQTYTNEKYGFELKYPPDAQINTDNTTDVLSNMPIEMGLSIKPVGAKGVLLINIITNQSGSTYDIPGPCSATTLGYEPDKETINSNNFVVWAIDKNLSMGIGNWGVGNEYCTVHNANRYDLITEIFYIPNTQSPSIEPIFNQILSTFKFTK